MAELPPDSELEKIWTQLGLSPQTFPIYYPIGPKQFLDGTGQPSGAVGTRARFTRDLSNFAHMFIGIRISNTYELPQLPTADEIARFRACKEFVDGEQTITINLAQQNIVVEPTLQSQITGLDGIHWHPFPTPFPMAGANNISIEVQRATSYPQIREGEPVIPEVRMVLLAVVLRADMKTVPPHRANQNI